MTGRRRPVSGDMTGWTLTQLVILFAFALMLAVPAFDRELAATERESGDFGQLERAAAEAAADARSVAQVYFGIDRPASVRPEASIADDIAEISNSLALFRRAIRSDDAQRLLADRTLPEIWTELAQARRKAGDVERTLGAVEGALAAVGGGRDAATKVAELVDHNRELRLRNLQLIGQLANLERRADGIGKPPCWVAPDGKPEYTYKITITDLDFVVEPRWRQARAPDIERIGAPIGRETIHYDDEEFSRAMYPFLAFGAESDPECRFFVQVVDGTGPFKGAWQARLALVEGYFYKYWVK
ncbi:MAG: hypothetical protein HKM95_00010 [Inquilinus sp.]|nr:hypothetical protein [Inquilinus sp.]